jgi:hypothetical protein
MTHTKALLKMYEDAEESIYVALNKLVLIQMCTVLEGKPQFPVSDAFEIDEEQARRLAIVDEKLQEALFWIKGGLAADALKEEKEAT